jgi:hypothetical protein
MRLTVSHGRELGRVHVPRVAARDSVGLSVPEHRRWNGVTEQSQHRPEWDGTEPDGPDPAIDAGFGDGDGYGENAEAEADGGRGGVLAELIDAPELAPVEVQVQPTGDPDVDAALAALVGLVERPTAAHAAIYEEVHRRLHDALADLDARP